MWMGVKWVLVPRMKEKGTGQLAVSAFDFLLYLFSYIEHLKYQPRPSSFRYIQIHRLSNCNSTQIAWDGRLGKEWASLGGIQHCVLYQLSYLGSSAGWHTSIANELLMATAHVYKPLRSPALVVGMCTVVGYVLNGVNKKKYFDLRTHTSIYLYLNVHQAVHLQCHKNYA